MRTSAWRAGKNMINIRALGHARQLCLKMARFQTRKAGRWPPSNPEDAAQAISSYWSHGHSRLPKKQQHTYSGESKTRRRFAAGRRAPSTRAYSPGAGPAAGAAGSTRRRFSGT